MTRFVLVTDNVESKAVNKYDECHEIFPSNEQAECDYFSPSLVSTLITITFNQHNVYHLPIEDIIHKLAKQFDDISCAEQNHSDLIAGIYEGKPNWLLSICDLIANQFLILN